MGTFNKIVFRNETRRARINSLKNIAPNAAQASFNSIKLEAVEMFESHLVTKELEGGETASNISNTLGGKGNLFSFIGFPKESKPVDIIREILELLIVMSRDPVIEEKFDSIVFKFPVRIPNLQTIYEFTPMPWENGKSWVQGIERGISGFSHYIYWKILPNPPSRSSTGVQTDNLLRSQEYKPTVYMSQIINNLRKRFASS